MIIHKNTAPQKKDSLIAAFCGLSFLLAIKTTSKLSNFILHQFGGLHKLWDAPLFVCDNLIKEPVVLYSLRIQHFIYKQFGFCG